MRIIILLGIFAAQFDAEPRRRKTVAVARIKAQFVRRSLGVYRRLF